MNRLSADSRSALMARVRAKDTAPELAARQALHARGLRFRLHRRDLPGRPDIVLPRYQLAILVHGCFWHGCARCDRGRRRPQTNVEFWRSKLESNRQRDTRNLTTLEALGWKTAVLWECDVRSPERLQKALDNVLTDEQLKFRGEQRRP